MPSATSNGRRRGRAEGRTAANGSGRPGSPRRGSGIAPSRGGDRVTALRNDHRFGVLNGTRGVIRGVDPPQRSVTIRADNHDIKLPAAYLDDGHLAHRYAITGHKAQGLTIDRAWVWPLPASTAKWGYVALSRAWEVTTLYLTRPQVDDDLHGTQSMTPEDPLEKTLLALQRTRAHQLAHDHTIDRGPELGIA